MRELVQTIYHSRATQQADTSLQGMERLLRQARARNMELGLTGALLYGDGRFAQVLEGSERTVKQVMTSIQRDRRHTQLVLLQSEEFIPEPAFADWAMAGLRFEDGRNQVVPLFGSDPQSSGLDGDCLLGVLKWLVDDRQTPILDLPARARTAVSELQHLPMVVH